MLTDLYTLLRLFHGRQVLIVRDSPLAPQAQESYTGEFRGVWRDAVPYYPDIECPAIWTTQWSERFTPLSKVQSITAV